MSEHAQSLAPVPRVLVPGTLCDARVFDAVRAHGSPHTAVHALSLDTLRDVRAWWQAQLARLPAQFDCVGFSLGGILSMALLGVAPQRVRRLVLVSSNADAAGPQQRSRSEQQLSDWQTLGARALVLAQVNAITPAGKLNQDQLQLLQDMAHDTSLASLRAQAELNASRPSGHTALQNWGGPVQLICGEADPWCGPAVQARIHAHRPDATLHTLANASHYTVLEQPQAVAQAIDSFLSH